jgi:ribulose-5-phosphate 4-epimerase/fuculose-1-phosphate aldolase
MSFDHAVKVRRLANAPMSEAEWQVRCDLAACYRLAYRNGWDDLVYTHVSAAVPLAVSKKPLTASGEAELRREPGPEHHFLTNPFGLAFDEITASNLVKVDLEGAIIGDTPYGINGAGFVIHSAVHEARADVGCVMHLHTEAGMALSMLACGLRPVSQHAMRFYDRIAYHDFEGLALDVDEKTRLVADLGPRHKAMILRNHGLLTCGATVAEAYVEMFYLEKSASAQLRAMATGEALVEPPPAVCAKSAKQFAGDSMRSGDREWPSLIRRLDREDPDYKS